MVNMLCNMIEYAYDSMTEDEIKNICDIISNAMARTKQEVHNE